MDDARAPYGTMYSLVFGETLLVGLSTAPSSAKASNALPIGEGVSPAAWLKSGALKRTSAVGKPLRFAATGGGKSPTVVHFMPLNEVVDERYTVYFNLTSS
jgi:hypothetical protein